MMVRSYRDLKVWQKAERLRFLSGRELDAVLEMTSVIGKMLAGLSRNLKASAAKSGP